MRMARSPYTITPFFPTSSRQFGRGGISVFRGSPIPHVQYGRGFGSLFKSVARVVTPLASKALRYTAKRGLETGNCLLSDVLSGENVKTAAKRRASEAFQQTTFSIPPNVFNTPSTPHRQKTTKKKNNNNNTGDNPWFHDQFSSFTRGTHSSHTHHPQTRSIPSTFSRSCRSWKENCCRNRNPNGHHHLQRKQPSSQSDARVHASNDTLKT